MVKLPWYQDVMGSILSLSCGTDSVQLSHAVNWNGWRKKHATIWNSISRTWSNYKCFYLCCWCHNRVLLFPQTRLREYSAPDLFVIDAVVNLSIKTENPAGPISFLKFVFKPSKIPVFVCCLISPQALLDNVIITRQSISKTKKLRRSCRLKCTS